jgi:Fe-S cluster assembly iron-binding protein IscA
VRTLRAIITNLRGGRRRRVIDLIGDDRPHRNDVVVLTERAAEAARRHMAEHGFPTGSAIRVDVTGKLRPRRYEITYDELPTTEGRDWIGQSHGVSILVFKKDALRLEGLTIDFQDGRILLANSSGGSGAAGFPSQDPPSCPRSGLSATNGNSPTVSGR